METAGTSRTVEVRGGSWRFVEVLGGFWGFVGTRLYKTLDQFNTINESFDGSTAEEEVSS